MVLGWRQRAFNKGDGRDYRRPHSLTKKLNHERQEWEEKRRGGNLAGKDKGKEKESSHQPINSNQVPPPVACAQTGKIKQAIEHIYQVI